MKQLFYLCFLSLKIFTLPDFPYFYDFEMKQKCIESVTKSFKSLYTATNCVIIDEINDLYGHTVVFLEIFPDDYSFSVGFIINKERYYERFNYLESQNEEEMISFVVSKILFCVNEGNLENKYDVYFTVKNWDNPIFNLKNGDLETKVDEIKKTISKKLVGKRLVNYFPIQYKELLIQKNTEKCISIRKGRYLFITFITENFYERVLEQVKTDIINFETVELKWNAQICLTKRPKLLSIKEEEGLYILRMLKRMVFLLDNRFVDKVTLVNLRIVKKILEYLMNKKSFLDLFKTMLNAKDDSVSKFINALKIFENENDNFIKKLVTKKNVELPERILTYLKVFYIDNISLKMNSGTFFVDFFTFLMTDMNLIQKIIMSEDLTENEYVANMKKYLYKQTSLYLKYWMTVYFEYLNGQGKKLYDYTDIVYFEIMKDSCKDWAISALSGSAIKPYFYFQALFFYNIQKKQFY
ncbi:hypothetical protein NGRA_0940 [Nosema granulosis]|uniref:Uncharacterized protein n=1 Tax=Nosema granulosis TaxID=83296 RepID=A0A9P6GZF9_9MICR|nr:hypothetical protein NGRA_0940 [Nosema granulosis]